MGFVGVRAAVKVPGCAIAPLLRELLDYPLHGPCVFIARPKIPAFGVLLPCFTTQFFGECEVA